MISVHLCFSRLADNAFEPNYNNRVNTKLNTFSLSQLYENNGSIQYFFSRNPANVSPSAPEPLYPAANISIKFIFENISKACDWIF